MQQRHKRHQHPRPVVPIHVLVGQQVQSMQHNKRKQQHNQQQHHDKQQQQYQAKYQHGQEHVLPAAGAESADKVQQPPSKKQKAQHIGQQHTAALKHRNQPQQQQGGQQPKHATEAVRHQQPRQRAQQQQQQQQQQQAEVHAPQLQQHQKGSKKRKRGSGVQGLRGSGAQQSTGAQDAAQGVVSKAASAGALVAAAAAGGAAAAPGSALPRRPWQANSTAAVSSNWQVLQQQLKAAQASAAAAGQRKPFRRKRKDGEEAAPSSSKVAGRQISSLGRNTACTPVVAMDCEMVGVGPNGDRDSLARVSIVNAAGNVLLDTFVAQKEAVVDYRTWVSGVTPQHLVAAPSLEEVQQQAAELLSGRVVVGHSLNKDLKVLLLSHPRKNIRDTAKYPPFMFSKGGKRRPKALKQLALQELGLTIQEGQHSSVDDARAALYLYQKHAADWERALKTPGGIKQLPTSNQAAKKKRVESYAAKAVANDPMADL